ncbi:hypothetical protein GCM10020218_064550 [Dactylosporangium vinaceum]
MAQARGWGNNQRGGDRQSYNSSSHTQLSQGKVTNTATSIRQDRHTVRKQTKAVHGRSQGASRGGQSQQMGAAQQQERQEQGKHRGSMGAAQTQGRREDRQCSKSAGRSGGSRQAGNSQAQSKRQLGGHK